MYRLATTQCLPSLPTFFFASDKASQDADGRDGCTGEKGAIVWGLEKILADAGQDQTPDNREEGAVFVTQWALLGSLPCFGPFSS